MAFCLPFSLMRKNLWLLCSVTALLLVLLPGKPQAALDEAFRQETELEQPNTLYLSNTLGNLNPEIIATDVSGRIIIFSSVDGSVLFSRRLDGEPALTAPMVGCFFSGEYTQDIVVGTQDGRVLIIDGSSLRTRCELKVSNSAFELPPTLVPLPDPDKKPELTDAIFLVDQGGMVHGLRARPIANQPEERPMKEFALEKLWEPINTGTIASAPASVGKVRQPEARELVIPTRDGKLFFVNPATGENEMLVVRENKLIATTPLLVDLNYDQRDDFIIAFENGDIWARSYQGKNKIDQIWNWAVNGQPSGDPVLVGTLDFSLSNSLLFAATGSCIAAVDPVNGSQKYLGTTNQFSGVNTQFAVVPSANGYASLAFGVSKVVRQMETAEWFSGVPRAEFPDHSVGEEISNTLVVGRVDTGTGPYVLVCGITKQGRLIGLKSTSVPLDDVASPWETRGGSPMHNPMFDRDYHKLVRTRQKLLNDLVAFNYTAIIAFKERGDSAGAVEYAEWLVESDRTNPDNVSRLKQLRIQRFLIFIILGAFLAVAFFGYVAFMMVRLLTVRNLESRAKSAVTKGKFEEAEVLYEKLMARKPKNAKISATLAMVYISRRNYSENTIPVYEKAFGMDRENQNLLHSYSRALLQAERTDGQALEVFEQALKTFPEPPLLEFAIGMCHKAAGRFEEASKRLRAALRGGLAREEVYAALCDVYLITKTFNSKALPVFKQQFPRRQDDQAFLEAYLEACIDAKQVDPSVESLCHSVLDLNPQHVPAYCHLGTIYLQRNEPGRAVEEIRRALEVSPHNSRAISLLAGCFLMEGRSDEQALDAYRRALKASPQDQQLLKILSDVYFRTARYDAEAVEVYHRSYEQNPNDIPTLRALAQTARLTSNHDLAIRIIEALNHQGQGTAELSMQLAHAYIAKGIYEPRTEGVYREAIRAKPDDSAVVGALSRVFAKQERDDIEALPVYERHIQSAPDDTAIGIQLARTYIKNSRYEDSLKLARHLQEKAPDHEELKRLIALSSLYDNKIDEAVEQYQKILQKNPNDKDALKHLALAYAQKGRTDDESSRCIQKALEADPNNPELHLAMARIQLEHKQAAKAVESYQAALRAKPGSEELLIRHINASLTQHPDATRLRWFLCEILVAYGHLREALENLHSIYEENPNHGKNILGALDKILSKDAKNITALTQKGRILLASNMHAEARGVLEQAYQLQPNSPEVARALSEIYEAILAKQDDAEVRFKLGKLHYINQEFDKAIGCFQKTGQDYRWEAESTKMLGKCFTAKGMLDLALQEFKKLVVDEETKELLYDLAQRYESKQDFVGAKTVYRQLFAADIDYKDVKSRFEMLSGSTSDPMAFEKTSIVQQMSEQAKRRYELLDELGRGAMGIVYRARDKELEEVVALKILPDSMSNNPEAVKRFKIEARNARKLSHPNIVRIHDIGEEMGRKYISMEFVDGSDLKRKLREAGKMSLQLVFHYGIQIADALAYAHRLGIVHRDIKPANIMLTSTNDVKITDFGIAKMLDQTGEGTMVGAVIGTPLYMSPEQVQGIPVDNRADIYAYGIMMYEFVNGRPPFTEGDLAYQHMHRDVTKPEPCPDALWRVISKCLGKRKEDRWDSADQIVDALKNLQRSETL